MEWTKDPVTGKIIVTFNNRTYPCLADADCDALVGPMAVCYSPNQTDLAMFATWTDINQCACPTNLQFIGAKCDQFSTFTITMQAIFIIALILAGVGICFMLWDVVRLIRAKIPLKLDALTVTACSATFGMISMLVFDSSIVAELFGLQYGYYPNHAKKFFDRNDISTPAAGFSFFFGTISCLNVSFAWIDVADAVASMTSKLQKQSLRYKRILLVYETIFLSLVIYGSVTNDSAFFTLPLVPAFIVILIIYLIAYRRLSGLIRSVSQGSVISSSDKVGMANQIMLEKSLRSIRSTVLLLVLNSLAAIIVLLTFFLLSALESPPTPERGAKHDLVSGFRWIVFVSFMLIISRYCHHSFSSRIQKASSHVVQDNTSNQRNQQMPEADIHLMENEQKDAIVTSTNDGQS